MLQWQVLPRLARLRRAIPKAAFSFQNLRGEDVLTQLQEAQIDFGLVSETNLPDGIARRKLGVVRHRLSVAAKRTGDDEKLNWRNVIERPLLGLEGDGRQMRLLRSIAKRHGVEVRPSVNCSSLPNVAMVLADHEGFAILPDAAERPGLVSVAAPFLGELDRPIFLVWSERRVVTLDAMAKWQRALVAELAW